jgi:hypothetical protein
MQFIFIDQFIARASIKNSMPQISLLINMKCKIKNMLNNIAQEFNFLVYSTH